MRAHSDLKSYHSESCNRLEISWRIAYDTCFFAGYTTWKQALQAWPPNTKMKSLPQETDTIVAQRVLPWIVTDSKDLFMEEESGIADITRSSIQVITLAMTKSCRSCYPDLPCMLWWECRGMPYVSDPKIYLPDLSCNMVEAHPHRRKAWDNVTIMSKPHSGLQITHRSFCSWPALRSSEVNKLCLRHEYTILVHVFWQSYVMFAACSSPGRGKVLELLNSNRYCSFLHHIATIFREDPCLPIMVCFLAADQAVSYLDLLLQKTGKNIVSYARWTKSVQECFLCSEMVAELQV